AGGADLRGVGVEIFVTAAQAFLRPIQVGRCGALNLIALAEQRMTSQQFVCRDVPSLPPNSTLAKPSAPRSQAKYCACSNAASREAEGSHNQCLQEMPSTTPSISKSRLANCVSS